MNKISFGAVKVRFYPTIDKNDKVFDEIKKHFPQGTEVKDDGISTHHMDEGKKSYSIYGKNANDERKICMALKAANFDAFLDKTETPADPRVQAALKYLKN